MQSQVSKPFYTVKEVSQVFGFSVATTWNKCNPKNKQYDPHFPKPIKISINSTRWLKSEIDAYITNLAANREQGA